MNSVGELAAESKSPLVGDVEAAIRFLQSWPCAMPQLTAIPVDPVTKDKSTKLFVKSFTYHPETKQPDWDVVRQWINKWQGKANIYFTVNRVAKPLQKKAEKTDISSVCALQVDIDLAALPDLSGDAQEDAAMAFVEKLLHFEPKPSVVVMSGGGAQAFWLLETPIAIGGNKDEAEEVERYTRGIEAALEAAGLKKPDPCHNVDRIMRLPGTTNLPYETKITELKRVPLLAQLVHADWTCKYSLNDFKPAPPKHAGNAPGTGTYGTQRELSPAEWNARKDTVAALVNTFTIEKLKSRGVPAECLALLENGDVGNVYGGDDSDMLLAIAGYLQRAGLSMEETCAVLGTVSYKGCAHVANKPHAQRWRAMYRAVNKSIAQNKNARAKDDENEEEKDKVAITYNKFKVGDATVATIGAIVDKQTPIFQNADRLVHVYRMGQDLQELDNEEHAIPDKETSVRYRPGTLRIEELPHARFSEYLEDTVRYYVETEKGGVVRIPVPPNIYEHVLGRKDGWSTISTGIRLLEGIAEAPFLRADGSVVHENGYDRGSRMFLDKGTMTYPLVPENPTREECVLALRLLADVFKEFPFVDDASRSVALSAVLTGFTRHLMSGAPIHAFDANSAATGKSTMANTVSTIISGRGAPAMQFTLDEEESKKLWIGILITGTKVVNIDNVDRGVQVGGATLMSIITEEMFSTRLLGQNINPVCSTAVLILINGNNLMFAGDTVSRTICCRMDRGMEKPSEYKYERDIKSWTRENRARLVTAALTVLRGHALAGRPDMGLTESRFKDWDRIVRSAIVWAGGADPMITQERISVNDLEKQDLATLLDTLVRTQGLGERFTSAKLMNECQHQGDDSALWSALQVTRTRGQPVTATGITAYFKKHHAVIINGRRLRMQPDARAATFWVEEVASPAAPVPEQTSMDLRAAA